MGFEYIGWLHCQVPHSRLDLLIFTQDLSVEIALDSRWTNRSTMNEHFGGQEEEYEDQANL